MSTSTQIDDGGLAFPLATVGTGDPRDGVAGGSIGMSLRDYFAAAALAHIPILVDAHEENKSLAVIAKWSYQVADAMLNAREKTGGAS